MYIRSVSIVGIYNRLIDKLNNSAIIFAHAIELIILIILDYFQLPQYFFDTSGTGEYVLFVYTEEHRYHLIYIFPERYTVFNFLGLNYLANGISRSKVIGVFHGHNNLTV